MNEQIDVIDFGAQKKIVKKKRDISVLYSKLKKVINIINGKEESCKFIYQNITSL